MQQSFKIAISNDLKILMMSRSAARYHPLVKPEDTVASSQPGSIAAAYGPPNDTTPLETKNQDFPTRPEGSLHDPNFPRIWLEHTMTSTLHL